MKKEMLNKNMSLKDIHSITNVPINEIKEIEQSMKD